MLDPVKLRVLRSVVETGSVRASAEALGYTPSAVSQHLGALRRETGVELVERSGRGIVVTPAGRALAEESCGVLDALDRLDRFARDLRQGRTGVITFSYASSVAATWVPRIAQEVREAFPELGLTLRLRHCSLEESPHELGDVLITDSVSEHFGAGWRTLDILEEKYVAIVATDHPLAVAARADAGPDGRPAPIRLRDLAGLPWAHDDPVGTVWFEHIASACRAAGFTPQVTMDPPDFQAILGFVATGEFVTVQPSLISQSMRADVTALRLVDENPRRRLQVRLRENIADNPAVRLLVDRVRAHARTSAEALTDVTVF